MCSGQRSGRWLRVPGGVIVWTGPRSDCRVVNHSSDGDCAAASSAVSGVVLSEWLTRAGFTAEPLRWFCGNDGRVVVEQDARWVDIATGEEQGRARVASQFLVDRYRIAKYVRHDDGPAALAAARLGDSDEVTERQAL